MCNQAGVTPPHTHTYLKTARAAAGSAGQRAGQMDHLLLVVVEEAHLKASYGAATLSGAAVRVLPRHHELLAHRVLQPVPVVPFAARED